MRTVRSHVFTSERLRVVETDFLCDRRWAQFVESHPEGLIYHHPLWLSALQREYRQRCYSLMCVDGEDNVLGVLPLFYTRGFPIRVGRNDTGSRLSSLPRTPVGGPLAKDNKSAAMLVEAAMDLVRRNPGVRLELKSPTEGLERLVNGLVCVPWRSTYVTEMPSIGPKWEPFTERTRASRDCLCGVECQRLRFGNARRQHRVAWAAKRASRLGLEVRLATSSTDLRYWYSLYLETMRKVAVPARPYRLFAELWKASSTGKQCRLFLAERLEGTERRIIAGALLLMLGQTAFYAFTGCAEKDLYLHANDLLQLTAIRNACLAGFRWYDFGEVAEEHLTLVQFKAKWGTSPKRLYRYYFPAPAKARTDSPRLVRAGRVLWRALPSKGTALLGDFIYRFL
jgi:hypothetical protein